MDTEGNTPDASIWATSTDLPGDLQERKVYFILIRDGNREINVALTTKPMLHEVHADVYVTPDYSYTIHDSCDHENDECVLDDPDFEEHEYGPQPGTIYQEVRKERLAKTEASSEGS
jgi:hypothetical protein